MLRSVERPRHDRAPSTRRRRRRRPSGPRSTAAVSTGSAACGRWPCCASRSAPSRCCTWPRSCATPGPACTTTTTSGSPTSRGPRARRASCGPSLLWVGAAAAVLMTLGVLTRLTTTVTFVVVAGNLLLSQTHFRHNRDLPRHPARRAGAAAGRSGAVGRRVVAPGAGPAPLGADGAAVAPLAAAHPGVARLPGVGDQQARRPRLAERPRPVGPRRALPARARPAPLPAWAIDLLTWRSLYSLVAPAAIAHRAVRRRRPLVRRAPGWPPSGSPSLFHLVHRDQRQRGGVQLRRHRRAGHLGHARRPGTGSSGCAPTTRRSGPRRRGARARLVRPVPGRAGRARRPGVAVVDRDGSDPAPGGRRPGSC